MADPTIQDRTEFDGKTGDLLMAHAQLTQERREEVLAIQQEREAALRQEAAEQNKPFEPRSVPLTADIAVEKGYITPEAKEAILLAQAAERTLEAAEGKSGGIPLQRDGDKVTGFNVDDKMFSRSFIGANPKDSPELVQAQALEHTASLIQGAVDIDPALAQNEKIIRAREAMQVLGQEAYGEAAERMSAAGLKPESVAVAQKYATPEGGKPPMTREEALQAVKEGAEVAAGSVPESQRQQFTQILTQRQQQISATPNAAPTPGQGPAQPEGQNPPAGGEQGGNGQGEENGQGQDMLSKMMSMLGGGGEMLLVMVMAMMAGISGGLGKAFSGLGGGRDGGDMSTASLNRDAEGVSVKGEQITVSKERLAELKPGETMQVKMPVKGLKDTDGKGEDRVVAGFNINSKGQVTSIAIAIGDGEKAAKLDMPTPISMLNKDGGVTIDTQAINAQLAPQIASLQRMAAQMEEQQRSRDAIAANGLGNQERERGAGGSIRLDTGATDRVESARLPTVTRTDGPSLGGRRT